MENKVELKKYILITTIITFILTLLFILINIYECISYTQVYNNNLSSILERITEYYPEVDKTELINILNNKSNEENTFLKEYGIDIKKENIILENQNNTNKFLIINATYILISFITLIITFLLYNNNKDKKIKEITKLIEKINKKNYELDIENNTEDELSILKNELYKTTLMLKEEAENSKNDKLNLKDSLSDISHQLKTPLTSIIISLDNILDNPNMSEDTKKDFIHIIKRETINISFLVNSILKLSKLDTNTIEFNNKEILLKDIIDKSIKNVEAISDLKNIKIKRDLQDDIYIKCDLNWQIEAISNILKNSLEYSRDFSEIIITTEKDKLYNKVIIEDKGKGVDKEDLPNIFKRFYKGKNASNNSIGIGLALAKKIIEKNNGSIKAESEINKGTRFIIKYYND